VNDPQSASTMDPRVERTRAAVLQATRDLLIELGVERTCIEMVAERSGVARSTVYRHWEGKPQLVMDALEDLRHQDDLVPTGDPEADLRALLQDFGAALRAPESSMLADLMAVSDRDAELGRLHRGFIRRKRARSLELIGRLQEAGRMDPSLDTDYLGELVAGALVYRRFSLGEPMTPDQIDAHVDEVLRRLAP
jgi:AcrR family transcriptional regulator